MLTIRPSYVALSVKICSFNVFKRELMYITLTNGQQPQEPSRSWQQVVSSGHSDSWSGQMTAFTLCSSWSHHTSQPTHINDRNTKKQHVNGRIESYFVVETVLRSFHFLPTNKMFHKTAFTHEKLFKMKSVSPLCAVWATIFTHLHSHV